MSCGAPNNPHDETTEPAVYCFERDSGRIVSAFKKVFHIDISREKLHWFEFLHMLGDLSGTAFTNVIDIRTTDPADVDKKKRSEFIRMKNRFALSSQYTAEEQTEIDEFMKLLQK